MPKQDDKRDWYVTLFEYGFMWPIGIWGIAGIVFYFATEDYQTNELVAAILLAVVAWFRFAPLPAKTPADHTPTSADDETEQ